jgi:flagellin-specific chaperone FliS
MTTKPGFGAYKKTSIQTSSKEQILLMLYQAAIKNCKKAIESIEEKNIAKKGEYVGERTLSSLRLHPICQHSGEY